MCQIFAGASDKIRSTLLNTNGLLSDLYLNNSDGLGAMYPTTKHGLRIRKEVPRTLDEARRFISQLPEDGRNLVLHFRMKTSGNIDRDNAHPFTVLPRSLAMTHNGVLSISTKSDETKCDTRHYIERIIRPQLSKFPDLVAVREWLDLVGDDIGQSNRFVFMDAQGEMHFVNRHTGIEHDGMWIANTYSFDAGLLIPGYASPKSYRGWGWDDFGYGARWGGGTYSWKDSALNDMDDEDDEEFDVVGLEYDEEIDVSLSNSDVDLLAAVIEEYPSATFQYLFREYRFEPEVDIETQLGGNDKAIALLLIDEDIASLAGKVTFSANAAKQIAEVCCWYGTWVLRDDYDLLELGQAADENNEAYAG